MKSEDYHSALSKKNNKILPALQINCMLQRRLFYSYHSKSRECAETTDAKTEIYVQKVFDAFA